MRISIRAMCQKRDDLNKQILQCRSELSKICPAVLVQSIRTKIQEVNSKLFNHLHQIKAHKLEQLTGPPISCDSSLESLSTVVTIPENLSLSDAEKSVLSKGLNFVPISKNLYQKEALRQLSDTSFYAKVDKDLTSTNQQIVKSTINELIIKQDLPATATNLIITTPRTSCIYFLPKIHKPNNPGRPIVSACSCPTELISSYLDKIMAPVVRSSPSHVTDSQHALQIFRNFNFMGEDKLIFTMDITSLYTVIPNGEGLLALKHFFDLCTVKEPSSETLLRLAELVLTLNCFSFATCYYKQINGVAMGIKMGPSYANLFVGYIEQKFFNQYNGPKPELYRCYIDDCVGTTSSTREELNQFITAVNSFHPAL